MSGKAHNPKGWDRSALTGRSYWNILNRPYPTEWGKKKRSKKTTGSNG
jgi:hypothetical protein